MKQYIALLRGINISGKNKVPMAELKKGFETLSFKEVKTYLNSGNVLFSGEEKDSREFVPRIQQMIKEQFGLEIPVFVISREALADILCHAPEWWGGNDSEIYHNLIFIIPPKTFSDVYHEMGEPKKELEKTEHYKEAIFWSFSRKNYQKTNWWSKTARADIGIHLTIRTANTIRKLLTV